MSIAVQHSTPQQGVSPLTYNEILRTHSRPTNMAPAPSVLYRTPYTPAYSTVQ